MSKKIIDALTVWGCDVTGALERFVFDENLYCSCLTLFSTDDNFNNLELAIAHHCYSDAFNYTHDLVGVAGNLGLSPLYQAMVELLESLRAKDYTNIEQQYKNVENTYRTYLNLLSAHNDNN